MGGTGNTVGGTATGARNIISAAGQVAVQFDGAGVADNLIAGNYIGTDITGTVAIPNRDGVELLSGATGNTVGGTSAGAGNLIAGNTEEALGIEAATNNVVVGNLIGVNASGTVAMANGWFGVAIYGPATGNTIGGAIAADRNVISGNSLGGVHITGAGASSNLIVGNFIGTDITGTIAIANAVGVKIDSGAAGNTVGVTAAGAGNLISGNTGDGVEISGTATTGNLVAGNLIGTDVTGTVALANRIAGVEIDTGASGNTIGGTASSATSYVNLISGNAFAGVLIEGSGTEGNVVAGNWIGTTTSGDSALPDGTSTRGYSAYDATIGGGIVIEGGASGNRIGTDGAVGDSGERNIISGNDNDGVNLFGAGTNVVAGNWIGLGQDGAGLGNSEDGVFLVADAAVGNTIGGTAAGSGNVISGNANDGVQLTEDAVNNLLVGNRMGTNAAGTAAVPNDDAVVVDSPNNTIGSTAAGAGNLLSGNSFEGIYIAAGIGSILVEGNDIGTDVTGTVALANGQEGIDDHGLNNTIGGTAIGAGNVISGNAAEGIYQAPGSATTLIQGNFIGTDIAGTVAIPNGDQGISEFSNSDTIGGTSAGTRNVISGNTNDGIHLDPGSVSVLVQGNYIGTNAAGTASLGNGIDGILVNSTSNTIGGSVAGAGNLISGNTEDGVEINGAGTSGNVVAGNLIGTDVTGTLAVGNDGDGVEIDSGASGNIIGGTTASARNIISGNADSGVEISGANANLVEGDYVGTDITGTVALGNNLSGDGNFSGVAIDGGASVNTIGGLTATPGTGAGNIISGNTVAGVFVNSAGSDNLVVGNLIGTDVTGTVGLGNIAIPAALFGGYGVRVSSSPDTIVGEPGGRNVISANGANASGGANVVLLYSTGSVVESNYIGTDITGTVALSTETGYGIQLQYGSYTIGGLTTTPGTGLGNVISGNSIVGIDYEGETAGDTVVIEGNIIGANATGERELPNLISGILLIQVSLVTIGGTAAGAGNLISGENVAGNLGNIYLDDCSDIAIEGNLIGTDITGEARLPALPGDVYGIGVVIGDGSTDNTIGGTTAAARNIISGTDGAGVYIGDYRYQDTTSSGNVVEGNYIGTDLSGTVAVANDSYGVEIVAGASDNTIGGTVDGASNVISGNSGDGVAIDDATGNLVASNWIGTNATGTAALGNAADGVDIEDGSSNNTIGGTSPVAANLISGNANGVEIDDSTLNLIQGNMIGTDTTGTFALGNLGAGVLVDSGASDNTIGGPVGGARNQISGNADGILVTGTATTGTLVAGNLIGTDVKGAYAIANTGAGIELAGGSGTTIGGTTGLARNVISGNGDGGDGVDVGVGVTSTLIEGNYIGVDQTGAKSLGNSDNGISVNDALGVTIGATGQGGGNVISGNAAAGVLIEGTSTTSVVILNNRIGTDFTGSIAIGNGTFGVLISGTPGVTIGGTGSGDANVISGNAGAGIGLFAGTTGTLIQANLIGTDNTGSDAIGNGTGILIDGGSSDNTIGGTASGAGNIIAFSAIPAGSMSSYATGDGVDLDATAGAGNEIRLNAIFSNTEMGIDLVAGGVAPGPNDYQNAPVIDTVVTARGTTTVTGTLIGAKDTTFDLDFYTLSSIGASGYAQGHYVLGSAMLTTDGDGRATFSFAFTNVSAGAQFVTATATDPNGNTSEFSNTIGTDHPPTAVIGFSQITVNEGSPVTFDGSGSYSPDGDTLTYSWLFEPGGETATGATPTYTFTTVGTYTVTLTVSDGFGGSNTSLPSTIYVEDVPPVFTPDSYTSPVTYTTSAPGNGFGTSVASVYGNVAIGAPFDNTPATNTSPEVNDTGAVYLYDGVPTDTQITANYNYGSLITVFQDPNPQAGDEFGASVAVVGYDLVVGAPGSSISGTGDGVAYVFDANYDSPTFGALLATLKIPDPNAQAEAHFGASVGTTNMNIVIGAHRQG